MRNIGASRVSLISYKYSINSSFIIENIREAARRVRWATELWSLYFDALPLSLYSFTAIALKGICCCRIKLLHMSLVGDSTLAIGRTIAANFCSLSNFTEFVDIEMPVSMLKVKVPCPSCLRFATESSQIIAVVGYERDT